MLKITDKKVTDFLLSKDYHIHRHILVNLGIFFITINIFWDTPDTMVFTCQRFIVWIIYYIAVIGAIYFNIFILIPRLLLQNKWIPYVGTLFGTVLGLMVILGFAQTFLMAEHLDNLPDVSLAILSVIASTFSFTLLMVGTTAIMLLRQWVINSIHISALETSALESELTYLKNQINPHFLFNMLNNAYLLIKTRKKEASEVLFQLEDMLKYQINNSSQKAIKLEDEIKFLQDFLNTEKVRRDNFSYTLEVEGNIKNIELPPLLFIPFVENAVKHNWNSEKEAYVKLDFQWDEKQLLFYCENSKSNIIISSKDVGGIGLTNIKRRLELLYPKRYTLEITENEETYFVSLKLIL